MRKKELVLLTARTADALHLIVTEYPLDSPWFGLLLFMLATIARAARRVAARM